MGELNDASVWMQVAFLTVAIGFIVDLFSYAEGLGGGFGGSATEAFLVIGFLCYLTAVILVACIVFLDALKGNKIALICFIVFALVAGVCTIIGVAIWGSDDKRNGTAVGTYSTMHAVLASLLAILAGIFAILDIAGVKAGK